MPIDPAHTAVVLIEYQNDFTSDGGALHGAVQPVMESTGMLDNTRSLVAAARDAGATIVHAPITFAEGFGELADPYGILKGVVDSTVLREGLVGCRDRRRARVSGGRHRRRGQARPGHVRDDEPRLHPPRARDHGPIALGGFLTNCCVESTMRTGYEKGYNVISGAKEPA